MSTWRIRQSISFTLSALETKIDTCAISADPDETARNEQSH